jgi:hypothetical protein
VQRWLRLDRLMLDPKDKRAIREWVSDLW